MSMKFLSAMTAVGVGHSARRSSMDPGAFVALSALAAVSFDVDGGMRVDRPAVMVTPAGPDSFQEFPFYASEEDRGAEDWEVTLKGSEPAPAESPAPLDPSQPAAEADTQPENAGDPPGAPLAPQSAEQEGVSFAAAGTTTAGEAAPAVQEVVQDAGAPALASGI